MADLTVQWAGTSQPQPTTASNFYSRFVPGTTIALGNFATITPPTLGAYETPNIYGNWVTAPFFSPTGVNGGVYTKGDSTGNFAGTDAQILYAWSLATATPGIVSPFIPTTTTTYYWG